MNDYSLKNTDFIYEKVGNKVTSLGFKVNNSLLGIKPAMIGGGNKKPGNNRILAVPAILAKFHNLVRENVQENSNTLIKVGAGKSEVVDNNLYDKLLDLMNPKPKPKSKKAYKKKYTRKKIKLNKRKRKTRKKTINN